MASKKSSAVTISLLTSVAAAMSGCAPNGLPVHLNASGQCINDATGQVIEQRVCYGYNGGYFGGRHYYYMPSNSARYYSDPASPGYVPAWGGAAGQSSFSSTVRGVFGGTAEGAGE